MRKQRDNQRPDLKDKEQYNAELSVPMLRIEQLSGGYEDQPVLKDISFELEKGEFLSLLGPNGSGKTTLLKLITGLLPPASGNVWINGSELQHYSSVELAKVVSVLSQEENVSFDFTVEEIVSLGRYPFQQGWFKTTTLEDRRLIDDMLKLTKVAEFKHIPFRLLSGGEKQRVLLAKALVQEPKLLILDEPTNHLDVHHAYELLQLLKEWQQSKQLTILAILHDLNLAALYSDRVALLHEGRVKEIGDAHILQKKDQLKEVYRVAVQAQAHPQVPKPQVYISAQPKPYSSEPMENLYTLTQDEQCIHVRFQQPLRTLSNGVLGEGLQWASHFCNFHVDQDYICSDPYRDMMEWLNQRKIPAEKSIGMMTAVQLENMAFSTLEYYGTSFMAVVTAGVGGAVDIIGNTAPQSVRRAGTINTMVFVDAHFTDGALVNASMSATEAKTKALASLHVLDQQTQTLATGTSTDSLCIACTQRGEPTAYAGSGTVLGKGIAQVVYAATVKAIEQYNQQKGRSKET